MLKINQYPKHLKATFFLFQAMLKDIQHTYIPPKKLICLITYLYVYILFNACQFYHEILFAKHQRILQGT